MRLRITAFAIFGLVGLSGLFASVSSEAVGGVSPKPTPKVSKTIREITFTDGQYDGKASTLSDQDWKRVLTTSEYYVMREEGTERAYSGSLLNNKKSGTYHCAACGLALFGSKAKYDSQTGWPSFFQPIYKKNLVEKKETAPGDDRIEVECARCGAHLGHVFDDGPEPTGLRYCMNSVSLKFKPAK